MAYGPIDICLGAMNPHAYSSNPFVGFLHLAVPYGVTALIYASVHAYFRRRYRHPAGYSVLTIAAIFFLICGCVGLSNQAIRSAAPARSHLAPP